jgi:hypothetical protein
MATVVDLFDPVCDQALGSQIEMAREIVAAFADPA